MNLRWYQTYDKRGVDSEMTLQYFDIGYGIWEDIPIVREPELGLNDEDNKEAKL
jgi:hypothetical protein